MDKFKRKVVRMLLLPRMPLLRGFIKGMALVLTASLLMSAFIPSPTKSEVLRFHIALIALIIFVSVPYILLSPAKRVQRLRWARSAIAELTIEQRLYVRVSVLLMIMLIVFMTGTGQWMKEFLVLSLLFIAYVAARDVLRWYRILSETVLGKGVIALGFASASSIAYGLAGQKIAGIIHVTPKNFTHTNLLVAIMMIPFLITLAGAFLSAVGIAFSSFFMALFTFPNIDKIQTWLFAGEWQFSKVRFARLTLFFQTFLFSLVGLGLFTFGRQGMAWYETAVARQIPSLVYELDMYHGTECKLKTGSKLAPLGDGKFLIAVKSPSGELNFPPPVKCDE
ncbi:hypothetical protein [Pseudoduganella namucuonensis]|uniref:hypothetical protein n=1 Tax=Pseudoduganella namucuonensis TaxID=1035707 RepID=UPI000B84567E|nr:hypothetical protein [Pseudoduganella namucuonensis]